MDRQWANAELLIEQLVEKVKVLRWGKRGSAIRTQTHTQFIQTVTAVTKRARRRLLNECLVALYTNVTPADCRRATQSTAPALQPEAATSALPLMMPSGHVLRNGPATARSSLASQPTGHPYTSGSLTGYSRMTTAGSHSLTGSTTASQLPPASRLQSLAAPSCGNNSGPTTGSSTARLRTMTKPSSAAFPTTDYKSVLADCHDVVRRLRDPNWRK